MFESCQTGPGLEFGKRERGGGRGGGKTKGRQRYARIQVGICVCAKQAPNLPAGAEAPLQKDEPAELTRGAQGTKVLLDHHPC